ncbi:hypothetical protein J8J20_23960, partial [Mycobacterium tuberculosis]|nr:hypothetical protein [Mycobacterium tuberculosis]
MAVDNAQARHRSGYYGSGYYGGPYYRHHRRNNWGGAGAGLAAGLILGGIIGAQARPYYGPRYYYGPRRVCERRWVYDNWG